MNHRDEIIFFLQSQVLVLHWTDQGRSAGLFRVKQALDSGTTKGPDFGNRVPADCSQVECHRSVAPWNDSRASHVPGQGTQGVTRTLL